jgi:hypothetical protein
LVKKRFDAKRFAKMIPLLTTATDKSKISFVDAKLGPSGLRGTPQDCLEARLLVSSFAYFLARLCQQMF